MSQAKQDKVKVPNSKKLPKIQISEFCNHLYKGHTFWSCLIWCANIKWIQLVLWKIQSEHDFVHRRTDGQTDGQRESSIPPFQLHWSGWYIIFQFTKCQKTHNAARSAPNMCRVWGTWPNSRRLGLSLGHFMVRCLRFPLRAKEKTHQKNLWGVSWPVRHGKMQCVWYSSVPTGRCVTSKTVHAASCLVAPSHYPSPCWLIIKDAQWH